MYREKGGNCTLAPRHFSLLSNLLFLFASELRIITMHLCIVFYITVCVDIYSMPERTRSKSEQFEESIPTGFIPTDRFLEFCDSSFFEDDRIPPLSSFISSVSIRIIAKFSITTNRFYSLSNSVHAMYS